MKKEEIDKLIANVEYDPQPLIDYITNLQEENRILKELNVCVGCNNYPDYKSRIDKAIEFVLPYRDGCNNWFEFLIEDKCKLLKILKGDENESN